MRPYLIWWKRTGGSDLADLVGTAKTQPDAASGKLASNVSTLGGAAISEAACAPASP